MIGWTAETLGGGHLAAAPVLPSTHIHRKDGAETNESVS